MTTLCVCGHDWDEHGNLGHCCVDDGKRFCDCQNFQKMDMRPGKVTHVERLPKMRRELPWSLVISILIIIALWAAWFGFMAVKESSSLYLFFYTLLGGLFGWVLSLKITEKY